MRYPSESPRHLRLYSRQNREEIMFNAFTVLWAKDRIAMLRRAGDAGKPLTVLFGGVHQSAPSLKRARVGPGDVVFPLFVDTRSLHVVSAAVVRDYIPLADYVVGDLHFPEEAVAGKFEYQIDDLLAGASGLG